MFASLNPAMLGIKAPLAELFPLAKENGFQGLDLGIQSLMEYEAKQGRGSAMALFEKSGMKPGCVGGLLPGRLSADVAEWDRTLAAAVPLARFAKDLGFTRTTIVMLPFHETLDFEACFALSAARLTQAAGALAPYGIQIGVEYVSQKTRRAGQKYEFIHDLAGSLKLLGAAGAPNLGVLLDSFHWHCAGELTAALRALPASRIAAVHLADAPDRPLDEQVAFERKLPGEGIADLKGFCQAVRSTGYDGPATCEPFCKAFETMAPEDVLSQVAKSLGRVMG